MRSLVTSRNSNTTSRKKAVGNLDFTTNPKVADEIGEVWEDAFAKHYDELRKTLDEAVAKKKAMGLARKDAKTFATKQAKEVAAARGKAECCKRSCVQVGRRGRVCTNARKL